MKPSLIVSVSPAPLALVAEDAPFPGPIIFVAIIIVLYGRMVRSSEKMDT